MIPQTFINLNLKSEEYFLTGSRALDNDELNYKVSTDASDYDYVVYIKNRHKIISYLNEYKIKWEGSCYNGGFKFWEDNKIFNIITCIDIEFMAWRESLSIIKNLIKIDELYRKAFKDKKVRYCIYEQLRGLCKSIITFGNNN